MKISCLGILGWLDGFENIARDINGLMIMCACIAGLCLILACQIKKRLDWKKKRSKARKPCS